MTIALTLEWANADSYANVWSLPDTEINKNNAWALKEQTDLAFDAIQTIPDDAIVTLNVDINGQPNISYNASKEDFLTSEYNQVRLTSLANDIINEFEEVRISQEAADMIKNYIQSLVK